MCIWTQAGKGRTGLVVCALLQHLDVVGNAEESLSMFASIRTADGKGVSVPSQKRYVEYYGTMKAANADPVPPERVEITLESLTLHGIPSFDLRGGCDPYMILDSFHDGEVLRTEPLPHAKSEETVTMEFPPGTTVQSDFRIRLFDADTGSADDFMCYFWLNPAYAVQHATDGSLTLTRGEIDGVHKDKKRKHFPDDFAITLSFSSS